MPFSYHYGYIVILYRIWQYLKIWLLLELKKEERKRKREDNAGKYANLARQPPQRCFVLGANKNESFVRSCSWGLLCERLCDDHVYVVHVYVVTVICSSPTSLGV